LRIACSFLFVIISMTATASSSKVDATANAIVVLVGKLNGTIHFVQQGSSAPVQVTGEVFGLSQGKYGFHVHELGDMSNGCTSLAAHYNPYNMTHGAPNDKIRHVGDLGNIVADANGVALVNLTDSMISLYGPMSILGRSVVVHSAVDDLGRGGSPLSKTTGNAGTRPACGIIGRAKST